MDTAFGLVWPGKDEALREADAPPGSTLAPATARTLGAPTSHVLIEGDNLETLRVLQRGCAGTVDLVALDPPYNTGRQFAYDDDWAEAAPGWLRRTGQRDADGHRTVATPSLSGRRHSLWLSMMAPRLALARRLLRPSGLLVVCIDDHEVHHLRMLLDELLGEAQFVAHVVWQKAYTANQTARWLSSTHDHLLVYARDASEARVGRVPRTDEQLAKFTNPDDDPRGPWKAENLSASRPYSRGRFTITTPAGREVRPPAGRCWRCSEAQYTTWLEDGRIWFGRDGTGRPMLKRFLSEREPGLTPSTWWSHQEVGSNKEASTNLKALFDGRVVFDTPKPVRLLRRIVDLFCPADGRVVDLFAGSGATGHAVLEANARDGGDRRALLVQLPTPTAHDDLPTLADVCHERMRRAWAALGGEGDVLRRFRLAPLPGPDAPEPERVSSLLMELGVPPWTPVHRRDDGGWWTADGAAVVFPGPVSPDVLLATRPTRAAVPDDAWADAGVRLSTLHALRAEGCRVHFHTL